MTARKHVRSCKPLYRGFIGIIGVILRLYWDNGKENGNYYNGIWGL